MKQFRWYGIETIARHDTITRASSSSGHGLTVLFHVPSNVVIRADVASDVLGNALVTMTISLIW